ncbi:ATP-dependent Clp protease adapter protein CLPS1, chloroplastic-like isoform X9 [Brassica napus]|uniref:ATP-dependent Clp protease adapter protein CLPS1, chloroplastic-like isoform X9 n=1 Tax=Brassica napus TaxID=3708 RepID=UPI002078520A|nr:ATP-dependent Clp protease adapter protein CLPS1, chloroplastic-like isoform X9 [Brassica napus]
MESAICGRLALAPSSLFNSKSADKHSVSKGPWVNNRGVLMTMSAMGKGGGVLDKPIIEKTTPGRESEFDLSLVKEIKEDGSTLQGDTTQRQLQQEEICGSGVDEGHTRHDCRQRSQHYARSPHQWFGGCDRLCSGRCRATLYAAAW